VILIRADSIVVLWLQYISLMMSSSLYREDRKKYAQLVREKRINGERVDDMREQVKVMLEKKFGRRVSVAKLESLIINPHIVELHQDQQEYAIACTQELKVWNVCGARLFLCLLTPSFVTK